MAFAGIMIHRAYVDAQEKSRKAAVDFPPKVPPLDSHLSPDIVIPQLTIRASSLDQQVRELEAQRVQAGARCEKWTSRIALTGLVAAAAGAVAAAVIGGPLTEPGIMTMIIGGMGAIGTVMIGGINANSARSSVSERKNEVLDERLQTRAQLVAAYEKAGQELPFAWPDAWDITRDPIMDAFPQDGFPIVGQADPVPVPSTATQAAEPTGMSSHRLLRPPPNLIALATGDIGHSLGVGEAVFEGSQLKWRLADGAK